MINNFVNQLNLQLQATKPSLEDICQQLRLATCATVTLAKDDGNVVLQLLHDDILNGSHNHSHQGSIMGYSLSISRNAPFSPEEQLAVGVAFGLCALVIKNKDEQALADGKRRAESIRSVVNTLSFSELEVGVRLVKSLGGKPEGLLVAGEIAADAGVSRSVVTAALRKLEGAGLVETRSLGMKGTYIRIKEALLVGELAKF
ncbi:MAG: GntR family transcriptional regulator [Defluviitaleaceae bacterium]|nr:GntR family transcriptional regulator [Defluviitaleaceae bacterium]